MSEKICPRCNKIPRVGVVAPHEGCGSVMCEGCLDGHVCGDEDDEATSICEHCTREFDADEIEPACKACGVDGLCSDCMAEHTCKTKEADAS